MPRKIPNNIYMGNKSIKPYTFQTNFTCSSILVVEQVGCKYYTYVHIYI